MSDITNLLVQREEKPEIEAVLPYYLDGDTLASAANFIAYLRAEKLIPRWAGIHNAWKASYKGKPLYYIRLNNKKWNRDEYAKWVVTPYLMHLDTYETDIIEDGRRDFVLDGFWRCKACGNGCAPGVDKTVFGAEQKNLCHGNFYSGRNWVWFYNPDDAAIGYIKKLLKMEQSARVAHKQVKPTD